MIKAMDLRKGKVISHDNELYTVHTAQHVAKGNKRSYIQAKLKSLKTGNLVDVRFSVDDRVETPYVENKEYTFLYRDGEDYVLMDQVSFDQIHVPANVMEDAHQYLKGNEPVTVSIIDGQIVSADLPTIVELVVEDAPPVVKGATATNQSKEVVMETGLRVKVPPFIENGETLRIDTRSGEYVERAK